LELGGIQRAQGLGLELNAWAAADGAVIFITAPHVCSLWSTRGNNYTGEV
jgi:hypothetical protein